MEFKNLLPAKNRDELRKWLSENYDKETECWGVVKRGRPVDDKTFWYIDAVEEAMCFGWIDSDILNALQSDEEIWKKFQSFPPLYQRVRVDTIQIKKKQPELFNSRLQKLLDNTKAGVMYGEWNDNGRLL